MDLKVAKTKYDVFNFLNNCQNPFYFLAGGTDLNLQLNSGLLPNNCTIIDISKITEYKKIELNNGNIEIGSLVTFDEIVNNKLLQAHIPWFCNSLTNFASPLLKNLATVGGNIANGSPTADSIPLLLTLDAKIELHAEDSFRVLELNEFFTGYKKSKLALNEVIAKIIINQNALIGYKNYYKKLGSRSDLTIAKTAFAGLLKLEDSKIIEAKFATASLSEFGKRLSNLEKALINTDIKNITKQLIAEYLALDVKPIDDFRSDTEYRFKATVNMIYEFIIKNR